MSTSAKNFLKSMISYESKPTEVPKKRRTKKRKTKKSLLGVGDMY